MAAEMATPNEAPKEDAIIGAMFRVVCADSQKASTPRMMPKRSLS